jgi:hypothetical protein
MEQLKAPSSSQLEKDRELEQDILSLQNEVLTAIHVLSDYVYMNIDTPSCPCSVRRSSEEFFRDFKSGVDCILTLLLKIKKYYCKKEYNNNHLASMIYLPKQQFKDYFSCNIQVIVQSVSRYRNNILAWENHCGFENNHFLRGQCTFFQEMLVDISTFSGDMYRWKSTIYQKLKRYGMIEENAELFVVQYLPKARRRTRLMATEILHASQQIVSRHLYLNDMSPVPVAIFQLRQAIEIRMLEILGIDSIVEDDGLPKKITANVFFDLPGLTDSIIFPVNLSNIKKIYSWTNIYVHMAICNNYWLLDFAQNYLINFVYERPIIKKCFYDHMKENLAEYIGIKEKNISLRNHIEVDIICDDDEFQKINFLIDKEGFTAYRKQKDECELRAMESYIQQARNS